MLTNLKELLKLRRDGEAIGSFNTPNLASLKAVISAAEELDRPVIIGHAEVHERYAPLKIFGPAMVAAAKAAKVPICVLLDHGQSVDYCIKAAQTGFTAVMYDGSLLSYLENLESTKMIADLLHPWGISVEGELGTLNRHETEEEAAAIKEPDIYTDPAAAEDFVNQTGVDALAVAFGTAHGIYFKEPVLDFTRLEEINRRIEVPLVMHGGSGISDENYRKVIGLGIEKINYYTYMAAAGGQASKVWIEGHESLFFHDIEQTAEEAMRENVLHALRVFSEMG
ncbi:MAG: class II fructose-bisphosphate aldolase [Dehalococcoidales bacterium]|nr:class II fructose-bisphosphate aldolase [Dehalococcoidales bacterium]